MLTGGKHPRTHQLGMGGAGTEAKLSDCTHNYCTTVPVDRPHVAQLK